MRLTLYLPLFFMLTGCQSKHLIEIDGEAHKVGSPPGTVQLEGNLFIDQTELENISYREYLYWLARVYGHASTTYQSALPDTSVWENATDNDISLFENYFRHPRYDTWPVVGLDYEQAIDYVNWRTSVVAESILIAKDYMLSAPDQTAENHFSWSSFLAGGESDRLLKKGSLLFPVYELPKRQLLDQQVRDLYLPNESEELQNGPFILLNYPEGRIDPGEGVLQLPASNQLYAGKPQVIHLLGNVAEMTDQKGIAVGGSWQHPVEESLPGQTQTYEAPQNWLGFRCVAKWVRVEF